jgi:UDP-glucose 4-epimerase
MADTVLVTGVAGFIGGYVARHFFGRGWRVAGLDVHPPDPSQGTVLAAFFGMGLPSSDLARVVSEIRPDVCVHCAGPASVGFSMEDPVSDFRATVPVTFNLLDMLRLNAPACRFIFTSSAAVYGNPSTLPIDETAPPRPISPYGFHKLIGEQLAVEFNRVYGLATATVRIFSAYGIGLKRQVLWDICRKSSSGERLTLRGTGNESRDFINAHDVARAMWLLSQNAPFGGEAYNVASGKETTIREVQEILFEGLDRTVPVEFDGSVVPGNPLNWRADMSRISALGFAPEIGLKQGALDYARWYLGEVADRG